MIHELIHYLEIAALIACLIVQAAHLRVWHGSGSCKKAGRPGSSSTPQ
jgi:hypothetical protein